MDETNSRAEVDLMDETNSTCGYFAPGSPVRGKLMFKRQILTVGRVRVSSLVQSEVDKQLSSQQLSIRIGWVSSVPVEL